MCILVGKGNMTNGDQKKGGKEEEDEARVYEAAVK